MKASVCVATAERKPEESGEERGKTTWRQREMI